MPCDQCSRSDFKSSDSSTDSLFSEIKPAKFDFPWSLHGKYVELMTQSSLPLLELG